MLRSSCTEAARVDRAQRQVDVAAVAGADLLVDGYNALITVEAALAGGVLLLGQDGCLRDLASLHGHFKRVEETLPALTLLGEAIADWGIQSATLLLDRPVSNSGRLAERMRDLAAESGWPWSVEVVADPDRELKVRAGMVATSDSVVLDRCGIWFNLAYEVVAQRVPGAAWIAFDNP